MVLLVLEEGGRGVFSALTESAATGGSDGGLGLSSGERRTSKKTINVRVSSWKPISRELEEIEKSLNPYELYLKYRHSFSSNSDFFLDVAEVLNERNMKKEALRIASNLSELIIENTHFLRSLAMFYQQVGEHERALEIYQKLIELRPDEPQSWRSLALCYADLKDYGTAANLLISAIKKDFSRFNIKSNLIAELNRILEKDPSLREDVDERFLASNPMDIKVILTWNADNVALNLGIREPTGQRLYYDTSVIGGFRNMSLGSYGPESYMLKKAFEGNYTILINPSSDRSQSVLGSVRARLDIYTNYGRENEHHTIHYCKLTKEKRMHKFLITVDEQKSHKKKIKRPDFYVVSPQDSLLRMAAYLKRFNVTWDNFKKANPGTDWKELASGQKLKIPKL